ncbi:MAG: hypothetical protein ACRCTE_10685 [Cellulosilyticaceae bacterium]
MRGITISEIREALRFGEAQGYSLFPQIRDRNYRDKAKTHPITQVMIKDIIALADQVKDQAPPKLTFEGFIDFLETGNRYRYEKLFFKSKNELHALVMAELMAEKGEYLQAIQERLWQWCDSYSWELPAHVPLTEADIQKKGVAADQVIALFSAESGFYFAEILSLLKDKIHPLLAYRLQQEIQRRIINPYKTYTFGWEEVKMNWASVCAGATGCAAIYQIQDIDELAQIILRVIGTMQSYLLGFDQEGVTTEGLGYWQYGFSFYMYFAELLKERTCGKLDLFTIDEQIAQIAKLPTYLQFPDMHMVNFSDAPGDEWHGEYGVLTKLQQLFGIDEYHFSQAIHIFRDHTSKWALLSRNVFWTLEKDDFSTNQGYIGTKFFEGSQWLIDRSYDQANQFVCFAAKGGHNDEPHNHNDLGNFILHYGKSTALCDLGAPEYTKAFFGENRYTFLHASSQGHSVPIINGCEQKAGESACAAVKKIDLHNPSCFALDLVKAYQIESLAGYIRSYTWDHNKLCLILADQFEFNQKTNTVEEVFMTHHPVEICKEKVVIHTPEYAVDIVAAGVDEQDVKEISYSNHFGEDSRVNQIKLKFNQLGQSETIKVEIIIRIHYK